MPPPLSNPYINIWLRNNNTRNGLILNLQKAMAKPTVQKIIAISDYEKLNDVVSSIDKLKLVTSEFKR